MSKNKNDPIEAAERIETRKEILLKCLGNSQSNTNMIISPLVEEVIFLEEQLALLRTLPHIKVHPKNTYRQEVTPAGKLYKDYNSRYADIVFKLSSKLEVDGDSETSPLREYLNARRTKYDNNQV